MSYFLSPHITRAATIICVLCLLWQSSGAFALPAVALQPTSVQTTLSITRSGTAPFDATTYTLGNAATAGTDADDTNTFVRALDSVTYRVELSVNNHDDTNLVSRITLDPDQRWSTLPTACLTSGVNPVSQIQDSVTSAAGGNRRVLVCTVASSLSQGTKMSYEAVAQVLSSVHNVTAIDQTECDSLTTILDTNQGCVSAMATAQSDHSALTTAPKIASLRTTANFAVDLALNLPGDPLHPERYTPRELVPGPTGLGLGNGFVMEYTQAANALSGSEYIDSPTKNFALTTTLTDNNPNNNGIFATNARLYTWDTAKPANQQDGCSTGGSEVTDTNLVCSQAAPGGPISVQLGSVNTRSPDVAGRIFTLTTRVWVPESDITSAPLALCAAPGDCTIQLTTHTEGIDGSDTAPPSELTSITGLLNMGGNGETTSNFANNDVVYPLKSIAIGSSFNSRIFFDGVDVPGVDTEPTGLKKASPGQQISMSIRSDFYRMDASQTATSCMKIDTSQFEVLGLSLDGDPTVSSGQFYSNFPYNHTAYTEYDSAIPQNAARGFPRLSTSQDKATDIFGSNEYRVEFGVAPVDNSFVTLRTSQCADNLDGNAGTQDWFTTPQAAPGGSQSINRIRIKYNNISTQKINNFLQKYDNASFFSRVVLIFTNFDLKVKPTATGYAIPIGMGTRNYAANFLATEYIASTGTTSNISPLITADTNNAGFGSSQVSANADRVEIIPATISATTDTVPSHVGNVAAGAVLEYTVQPLIHSGLGGSTTLTLTDTLPLDTTFVAGSFAEIATPAANGVYSFPTPAPGDTSFVVTLTGVTLNQPIRPFHFKVMVKPSAAPQILRQVVSINSTNPTINTASQVITGSSGPLLLNALPVENRFGTLTYRDPQASITTQVLAPSTYSVTKNTAKNIYEAGENLRFDVVYSRTGASTFDPGRFIDILPFNGDAYDSNETNFTPDREDILTPDIAQGSHYHDSSTDTVAGLAALPIATNGETFLYTTATANTLKNDVCHSSNLPTGFVPIFGHFCYNAYIANGNQFPDGAAAGSGATLWSTSPPSDLGTVTGVMWNTTAHPAGSAPRTVTLTLDPTANHTADVYCNSAAGRIPNISLSIISNDACARVVAGSISGSLWLDLNENSTPTNTESETPIPSAIVELWSSTNTPILDYLGNPITATTSSTGLYHFDNLPSGIYRVHTVVDSSYQQTFDLNDPTANNIITPNNSGDISLTGQLDPTETMVVAVTSASNVNFSYTIPAQIGERLFFDANNNQEYDVGDTTINGIVSVYADADQNGVPDGAVLTTGTLQLDGTYLLDHIPWTPGATTMHYLVKVNANPQYFKPNPKLSASTANDSKNPAGYPVTLSLSNKINKTANFGYVFDKGVSLKKTVYIGNDSGAGCPTATDTALVTNPQHIGSDVTWCYLVTNTGDTNLSLTSLTDPTTGATLITSSTLTGGLTILIGQSTILYYHTIHDLSVTGAATITAQPVDDTYYPLDTPPVTAQSTASFVHIFDPAIGVKTGKYLGNNEIEWKITWFNTNPIAISPAQLSDEIPINTTYTRALACTSQGSSTISGCSFEQPSATYPRGRIIGTASLAADPLATNETNTTQAVFVTFITTAEPGTTSVQNQANLTWTTAKSTTTNQQNIPQTIVTIPPAQIITPTIVVPPVISATLAKTGAALGNAQFLSIISLSILSITLFVHTRRQSKKVVR
jgi:hypothetical protein